MQVQKKRMHQLVSYYANMGDISIKGYYSFHWKVNFEACIINISNSIWAFEDFIAMFSNNLSLSLSGKCELWVQNIPILSWCTTLHNPKRILEHAQCKNDQIYFIVKWKQQKKGEYHISLAYPREFRYFKTLCKAKFLN